MLSPTLILVILAVIALGGITLLAFQWWILGGLLTVIGLGLLYFYWRINQILQIGQALGTNDVPKARRLLDKEKNPQKLNPYSKTYYFFFLGMTELQEGKYKEARASMKTALETNRFRAVDEKATAHVVLAQLDLRNRNTEGARRHLREAKGLEPSQQIREQIQTIVKQARLRL